MKHHGHKSSGIDINAAAQYKAAIDKEFGKPMAKAKGKLNRAERFHFITPAQKKTVLAGIEENDADIKNGLKDIEAGEKDIKAASHKLGALLHGADHNTIE